MIMVYMSTLCMSTNKISSVRQEFQYRMPKVTEAALISHLFADILETNFPMFSQQALMTYQKPWALENLMARIQQNNDLLIAAWHQEKPIGLVSGPPSEAGVGTIIWLLVDNVYQNHGIGRHLLQLAANHYRRLDCHKLKLTAPSEQAKRFYEKQGMTVEGYHPNHWWHANYWALALTLS